MTKISSYVSDDVVSGGDRIIGTDIVGNVTKNYAVNSLGIFFSTVAEVLENKIMDFSTTGTNTISLDAIDAKYNNTDSGLTATNVKAAIDELSSIDSRREVLFSSVDVNPAITSKIYAITTGATNKTVTLPASPTKDDELGVSKVDNGIGFVIIDGNGNTVKDSPTQTISRQYTSITLHYNGSGNWIII